MDKVVSDQSRVEERLERLLAALGTGVILLDPNREIAWMDERTRARLNGGSEQFAAMLRTLEARAEVHCVLCPQEVVINGEAATVCLILENESPQNERVYDAVAAIEAVMADTSWFTRTIIEKVKALRQIRQPAPRASDLEILSDREREVLGLICEGRSDVQMSSMLGLSQNTVRNHIAALYRKIGVNRRTAAIIWARERGITPEDALPPRRRTHPLPNSPSGPKPY
jgi:DNA-binding NarL/FixJ family response regulator